MPDEFDKLWVEKKTVKIAYDANKNPEYVGEANPGTATSATGWRIKKITYNSDKNPTDVQWADSDMNFNNVWDDRENYVYG